jgi:twitching motility protein PilT
MTDPKRLLNPELDRLIQEMNLLADAADVERTGEAGDSADPAIVSEPATPGPALDAPKLAVVADGEPLERLLTEMVRHKASDLLLVPGHPPVLRINGLLRTLGQPAVDGESVRMLFAPHLGARGEALLREAGAVDLSLRLDDPGGDAEDGWRLRVNLQRESGGVAAAVRALPRRIAALAELGLPASLAELVRAPKGLILVCGPTGSGKTTTMAAMLDALNRSEVRHVITIEDPIEYRHVNRRCIFEQVEVGRDSPSFAAALRAALRRDPDVILVGEMRDLETMATAITAAETGHLILATLHTSDVGQAVHRVVDVYSAAQQTQIRHQLALSLHAILCQQLVPRADGKGRVPAIELLLATYAVRATIRSGAIERLPNELLTGRGIGMRSLEQSLAELVAGGVISTDEARSRAVRPDELARLLGSR